MKNKKILISFQKRNFFLKFLDKRYNLNKETNKDLKITSFDYKQVIDEKNIQLNWKDLYRDWSYFRKEYYFDTRKHEIPKEKLKERIPFTKEQMSFKSVYNYFMEKKTLNNKSTRLLLGFYCVIVYFYYKLKTQNRKNDKLAQDILPENSINIKESPYEKKERNYYKNN